MLKMHEIREIIRLMDQSGITHLELELEGNKLLLKKEKEMVPKIVKKEEQDYTIETVPAPAPIPIQEVEKKVVITPPVQKEEKSASEGTDQDLKAIVSPMVGTFYAAPNPEAKPYVSVGDHVEPNTVVCIIEAMKLFNEIEADVRGTIVKTLVENGQLVEYGQPLFLVKPE